MKNKNPKILALIPLRGGSKSIRYKNIRPLAGKPLAYWILKAATSSKHIDEVWVSTEDPKIKEAVLSLGLPIKVIDRPHEFAQDHSTTEEVMKHFAENVPFDILVTIQATSPLTKSGDLDSAIDKFIGNNHDSMVTGVLVKRFFWKHNGDPYNYNPVKRPMRQEWDGTIMENGAFYITKKETLEKHNSRLGGKIGVHIMPEYTGVEIDEPEDWEKIERTIKDLNINTDEV